MKITNNYESTLKINNNVVLSGLRGKALDITMKDIPKQAEIKAVIPSRCFNKQTNISLAYLLQTFAIQTLVVILGLLIPLKQEFFPIWILYAFLSGTTAMGFWVLAHECGHGAFSDNKKLEMFIGYLLHSALLVPYFSWQRSHAIHHRFTNHITDGETHVPLVISGNGITELKGGEKEMAVSKAFGDKKFGIFQIIIHLLIGWPAYLLAGKTGGPSYGMSNHFWPITPFSRKLWPSAWSTKVWLSDCGIIFVLSLLFIWANNSGFTQLLGLYFGPLIVVNIWLVTYTWLHHTDSDVPHLSGEDFTYIRGAFLSVDRPYGKILDFLHHRIGSTHVIHHIYPGVPHYHAKEATNAIRKAFPKIYLFNPTPIHKALWHIATNCVAVSRESGSARYLWRKP